MKALRTVAGLALALLLQSLLARMAGSFRLPADLVLVAVVTAALLYGRVAGLLGGTLAGLAQDGLVGGVIGIGGLASSLAGFVSGAIATQFIVTQAIPRFLLFVGATFVHGAVFMGLYQVLGLRLFEQPYLTLTTQALINAGVGLVAFGVIETLPGLPERMRIRRERRRKVRFH
ncbi:MAG: rod shape-determining protein MreD [Acidobacteriota bacterium]